MSPGPFPGLPPLGNAGGGGLVEQFALAFEALGAEWVMWLLLGLSVVSVAVMIERIVFFARNSFGDVTAVSDLLAKGDLAGAVKLVGEARGMEAEVVREAVRIAPQGPEAVEERVESVIIRERLRYERFLSHLGTLGNNAPFIGLFGTVLGIINAFAALATSAKSGTVTSGSSNVMAGISEALVATAVGLLVALPAVALYNVFGRWLKSIVARSNVVLHALLAHLKATGPEDTHDTKPAEKSSNPKPADAKPADAKPADAKPAVAATNP